LLIVDHRGGYRCLEQVRGAGHELAAGIGQTFSNLEGVFWAFTMMEDIRGLEGGRGLSTCRRIARGRGDGAAHGKH
jgi:hypothetical protein